MKHEVVQEEAPTAAQTSMPAMSKHIGEGSKRRKKNFKGRGVAMRSLIFNVSIVEKMDMKQRNEESLGTRSKTSRIKKKQKVKHQI